MGDFDVLIFQVYERSQGFNWKITHFNMLHGRYSNKGIDPPLRNTYCLLW